MDDWKSDGGRGQKTCVKQTDLKKCTEYNTKNKIPNDIKNIPA